MEPVRGGPDNGQVGRRPDRLTGALGALAVAVSIGAVVFAAHGQGLGNGFVSDDVPFIEQNPVIRGFGHLPEMFSSTLWETTSASARAHYRPLVTVSYAVNYALGGLEPFGYHLANLLLHWANAVLLFLLVATVSRRPLLATSAALLFAAHPITSESVAWAAARSELLAGTFCLGALLALTGAEARHKEGRRVRDLTLALLLFCLALLSKEGAIALVGVLVLRALGGRTRRDLGRAGVFAGIGLVYLGIVSVSFGGVRSAPIDFVFNPLIDATLLTRVLTGLGLIWKALCLLTIPTPLVADYSFNAVPIAGGALWMRGGLGAVLLLLGVWAATIRQHRGRTMQLGVNMLIAFLALLLVNAISPVASLFAERFLYLPAAGFCVAAVSMAGAAFERSSRGRVFSGAALVLLLGVYGLATAARTREWKDELTLFRSAAETQPHSAWVQAALSSAYFEDGDIDGAHEHALRAREIYPEYAPAWNILGDIALARGQVDAAVTLLRTAVEHEPGSFGARVSLGVALQRQGDLAGAEQEYRNAVALNPRSPAVLNNLANVMGRRGNRQGAIGGWEQALAIDPYHPEALFNLGREYESAGHLDMARQLYVRFIESAPQRFASQKEMLRSRLGIP